MNAAPASRRTPTRSARALLGLCGWLALGPATLLAQPVPGLTPDQRAPGLTPDQRADADLQPPPAEQPAAPPTASAPLYQMARRSGWLLAPIGLMSIAVVAVGIERTLGLRRSRVTPRRLFRRLREQIALGDIDPALARAECERHPSSAADVVTAMLAKVGRPHAEVEAAAAEEIDRQADRLFANVRTLNLAAAVAPLMGLLGTVWGMIQAFFVTASLPIESNKGQALADGIYVALFTTFAGLAVAIPAAVLAHSFEGRILGLLRRVEKLVAELAPQLERFEGQRQPPTGVRTDGAWDGAPGSHAAPGQTAPTVPLPAPPPVPPT